MTAIQHLNSRDLHGRALRARRLTVRVLRLVGIHAGNVTIGAIYAAVIAWMVNDVVEFTTVLNITSNRVILLILAAWGTTQLIRAAAYDIADRVDPDRRDSDDLWDVAAALRANAQDITNGADYDEIRLALQTSEVLPALHGLTARLRGAYAQDGEMEEASALSDTTALIRAAAESLGHRELSE
ncbi:hypothetical protein GCM10010331_74670 [Streptomyces xanthochromogenes]|uniref:hypothetical protein n=1 Tax=Streptomyces xanthochromogenes TaxID=67384 RepID=UPI001675BADF|nr:hypothetical protein [Streptomyces xanthochromogenes]GHB75890.1 hypothetical protein GCM10010331_74670 [Streptomyces xanthochromogenes]